MQITWEEIIRVQPKLEDLRLLAVKNRTKNYDQANKFWYFDIKSEMVELVGCCSSRKVPAAIKNSDAYKVAYDVLWGTLYCGMEFPPGIPNPLIEKLFLNKK